MEEVLSKYRQDAESIISYLREDLKSIRTGRANPSLVENLIVETYGGQAKLKLQEVATITLEANALSVIPFDHSTLIDIEKAILKSPLGLSPVTQGNRIIIKIPTLSEEQRQKMVKLVHQKIEERKNMIRNARDDQRRKIKSSFENKEITEDNKFRLEKEIDSLSQQFMKTIEEIKNRKEEEIMEV